MGTRRGHRGSVVALLTAVALLVVSCTSEPAAESGPAAGGPASTATTAVEPAGTQPSGAPPSSTVAPSSGSPAAPDCGDDRPGRYADELFEAAPTVTVEYAPGLQADVHQPLDDPAACRVGVVWIHGGGFTQGTRGGGSELAWGEALARRGFVLASIDYRLGTEGGYGIDQAASPERRQVVANAIADGAAALDWLRGPAGADLRVDPARAAVGGTSAGAMTALGVGLSRPAGERPCGIVSIAGDMDADWDVPDPPAALLVHGTIDILVPYRNAVAAQALLTGSGGDVTLDTVDGAGHELAGVPPDDVVAATADWLAAHVAAGCG